MNKIYIKLKPIQNIIESHFYSFSLILITVLFLLITESYSMLLSPQIWAEDGSLFLVSAFKESFFSSIFQPYGGYFHTFPRIIASFAYSFIPIEWIPLFIVVVCFSLFIYTITEFTRKDYDWIIRNSYFRLGCSIILILTPGTWEAVSNLANTHWVLFVWLSFLSIKSLNFRYRFIDYLFIFLAISSEGMVLLLLPAFMARLIIHYLEKRSIFYLFQEWFVVIGILVFAAINLAQRAGVNTNPDFMEIFYFLIQTLFAYQILHPIMGDELISFATTFDITGLLARGVIVSLFIIFLTHKYVRHKNFFVLLFFFGAYSLIPVSISIARPGTSEFFIPTVGFLWGSRYAFCISISGIILWVFVISKICEYKKFRMTLVIETMFDPLKNYKQARINLLHRITIFIAFIIMQFIFYSERSQITPHGKTQYWVENAAVLSQSVKTGCPQQVTFPIYPKNWTFTYTSPKKCAE